MWLGECFHDIWCKVQLKRAKLFCGEGCFFWNPRRACFLLCYLANCTQKVKDTLLAGQQLTWISGRDVIFAINFCERWLDSCSFFFSIQCFTCTKEVSKLFQCTFMWVWPIIVAMVKSHHPVHVCHFTQHAKCYPFAPHRFHEPLHLQSKDKEGIMQ